MDFSILLDHLCAKSFISKYACGVGSHQRLQIPFRKNFIQLPSHL